MSYYTISFTVTISRLWFPFFHHCFLFAARNIKIVKKLEDVEVMEKESAAFVCEVSHDEVDCQWYKGSTKLKAGENIKMRQEGTTPESS